MQINRLGHQSIVFELPSNASKPNLQLGQLKQLGVKCPAKGYMPQYGSNSQS